jgi:hypothetical protein
MFPSDRVAQLHPQVPDSLLIVFGGGILTRLHTGHKTILYEVNMDGHMTASVV